MTRESLPNRRQHESFAFENAGLRCRAGIGRFDDGRLAELFLNRSKTGTDLDTAAKDAAIVTSIALQCGADLETFRRTLTRNRDSSASGVLGAVLDMLELGT
jgi:ribonucleoside-diphosphate reductase alpha chain